MNGETAIKLLKKFNKILDRTNPPDDLAEAIGFDKTVYNFVNISIIAGGGTIDGFAFKFSMEADYETIDEISLSPNHPIIIKYNKLED